MSRPLRLFRSTWGHLQVQEGSFTFPQFISLVKGEGIYSGIEIPLVFALKQGREEFCDVLRENNLKAVFMIFGDSEVHPGHPVHKGQFPTFPEPNCHDMKNSILGFQRSVEAVAEFGDVVEKVNSHSIRDWNTLEQAQEFFDAVIPWQSQFDFPILHETHRKRWLHSPWVCRDFVDRYDERLRLVADLSHFTCVAEVGPDSPELTEVINQIAPRVDHVHARYGFDHGPQIPDPRSEYWAAYIDGFEKWWDTIWAEQQKNPKCMPTLTPEHGPPNYQWVDPRDGQPCADIVEVNSWIAARQKARYESQYGQPK